MQFRGAGYSNVGRTKDTNQDSYAISIADTKVGNVALVIVADGMGGLEKGELASAEVVRTLSSWFAEKLPPSLEALETNIGGFEHFVEGQWHGLVQDLNLRIMRYGMQHRMNLGTTLTALLVIGARYSIVHVGDSRVYEITDKEVKQITTDQTFVKREIDAGRMTVEESLSHPNRNMLLQCLGSSKEVVPDIIHGTLRKDATYLLCSDGFRHVLTDQELKEKLCPKALNKAWDAQACLDANGIISSGPEPVVGVLSDMTTLVMDRKERDNITAVVLRVEGEGR